MHRVWHFDQADSAPKNGASLYRLYPQHTLGILTFSRRHRPLLWSLVALAILLALIVTMDRSASQGVNRATVTNPAGLPAAAPSDFIGPTRAPGPSVTSVDIHQQTSTNGTVSPSHVPSTTVTVNGNTTTLPPNATFHEEIPSNNGTSSLSVNVDSTATEGTSRLRVRTHSSSSSSSSSTSQSSSTFTNQ